MAITHSKLKRVELPKGWDVIENHQDKNSTGYKNYYKGENLKDARVVLTSELDQETQELKEVFYKKRVLNLKYKKIKDIEKISKLDRAIILAHINTKSVQDDLKLMFHINKNEILIASTIINLSPTTHLSPEDLLSLKKYFNYKLEDLLNLDIQTAIPSILNIYTRTPEELTSEEWKKLFLIVHKKLDHFIKIATLNNDDELTLAYFKLRTCFPPHFLGSLDLWEEARLLFPNKDQFHYLKKSLAFILVSRTKIDLIDKNHKDFV